MIANTTLHSHEEDDAYPLDPVMFEHWCADNLRDQGWNARTTKGSGDQGVDVIAEKDGYRVVLQCKLYSSAVGNKAVHEANGGKLFEDADLACVVTNNQYTLGARSLAQKTRVMLLHADDMRDFDNAIGRPVTQHRAMAAPQPGPWGAVPQLRSSVPAVAAGVLAGGAIAHGLVGGLSAPAHAEAHAQVDVVDDDLCVDDLSDAVLEDVSFDGDSTLATGFLDTDEA